MLNIEMKFVVVFALFFICCCAEEQCSRYHYEEQTLAKVVRLEYRLERLEKKVKNGEKDVPVKIYKDCPDFWIRFNESCYLFEEKKYAFFDARFHCNRFGADLVHINDCAENDFLKRHVKTLKTEAFWIGLEDTDREGVFKWVDDKATPSYADWEIGQPNNYGGKEDCVHIRPEYLKWNDNQCSLLYGSVCEIKPKV